MAGDGPEGGPAPVGPGPDPERLRAAWQGTIEDMSAMADARREQAWDVAAVPSGDTAPEHRAVGDTDRFGLTFVVPESHAGRFRTLFQQGSYPTYEVFRREMEGRVFLVVEYRDDEEELSILAAGQYDRRNAARMTRDATDAGEFFTHFQTVDGDHLGTFRHDGHDKFVPEADDLVASLDETSNTADDADGET